MHSSINDRAGFAEWIFGNPVVPYSLREHPQMTSALRGSTVVPKNKQNCTEKLCECRGDKGVQNCILLRTSLMPRDAVTGHAFFILGESSQVKLYPTFLLLNFEMRVTSAQVRRRLILPGPADKRLTGKGEKMTYSPAAGCNWLCLAGV